MSSQDPYYMVKGEVMKSVNGVTQLFERWKELAGQRNRDDEFTWTTDELKTGLTSIEWDVQDLEQSNRIVSENNRFKVDPEELLRRKAFVEEIRQTILRIKQELERHSTSMVSQQSRDMLFTGSNRGQGSGAYDDVNARLEREMIKDNDEFLQKQSQLHVNMMQEHEEDIRHLEVATDTLGSMAHDMRDSLARSNKDLEDLDQDMDSTLGKVRRAIQGVDRLLTKADDKWGWYIIAFLAVALIVLLVLVFYL